ncbi:hypothetical protein [Microbacterium sp. Marseille-Q6965]|uniref:hypothetical protein n=1 Tax=Microbacterium sp. Marseille-Q6965 TaxID=2965072 RepID=UPI0021B6F49F|nr:hypothetical protein [Microbacterium sp. Marseille-Q6965]
MTTAAWTDNTLFSASADAATFDLEGSMDGATWVESDDPAAIQLAVPASTFADLLPGESRSVTLHVRNVGSVSAALSSSVVFSNSTFTTNPTATVDGLATPLFANTADEFTLTVTAPEDWSTSNQGQSASIVVTISGQAVAS